MALRIVTVHMFDIILFYMFNTVNPFYRGELKVWKKRGAQDESAGMRGRQEAHAPPLGCVSHRAVIICFVLGLHGADDQDAGIVGGVCGCREAVRDVRGPVVVVL